MSNEYTAAREALAEADKSIEHRLWIVECRWCSTSITIDDIADAKANGIQCEDHDCRCRMTPEFVQDRAFQDTFTERPRDAVNKKHLRWALDEIDRLTRGGR